MGFRQVSIDPNSHDFIDLSPIRLISKHEVPTARFIKCNESNQILLNILKIPSLYYKKTLKVIKI